MIDKPRVHNKHHDTAPPGAVYIGRGSPFGNPFVIGPDGDREAVCYKHIQDLRTKPELVAKIKEELAGKDLVCFCKPRLCHGDYLFYLANSVVLPFVCPLCDEPQARAFECTCYGE